MSKFKKVLLMCTAYVLVAALAIGGTIAYLQDSDSDVNVMTLGNVSIAQHEYERVVGEDGKFETITTDSGTGYKLQPFTQAKPLYPTTNTAPALSDNRVYFDQLGEGFTGSMKAYDESVTNVLDKYVLVENTGKTDAYVRALIAYEAGRDTDGLVMTASRNWTYQKTICTIEIDGATYAIDECVYNGGEVHTGGILPAGEATISPCLGNIYAKYWVDNEWCEAIDSNNNGTWDVLVLSQAVQTAGFADAKTALDTAFGETNAENAAVWFGGVIVPSVKTLSELREAMATGGEFALANDIVVEASDLLYAADGGHSDGSAFFVKNDTVIDLNGHDIKVTSGNAWSDVFFMKFGADLTIKGEGDIEADCSIACVYDANSTLNVEGGNFYVTANNDMLYAIYGKINVSGGTFTTSYWNTINIYGSGRVDRVDVSGGSFENWNPASSPDGNLLADGYKVVSEVVDGVTWYTVVAE